MPFMPSTSSGADRWFRGAFPILEKGASNASYGSM